MIILDVARLENIPWALADYGFRVIIAGGFADIFYMNCMKNGMLPIVMDKDMREQLAKTDAREQITVDLENEIIITNMHRFHFTIEKMWKEKLLNGLDEISITMQYEQEIKSMKEKWLYIKKSDGILKMYLHSKLTVIYYVKIRGERE